MLIFDAHLDLSLNALEYNRDLRQSVKEIRNLEQGLSDLQGRGSGTVAFPEMREVRISGFSKNPKSPDFRNPEKMLFQNFGNPDSRFPESH